ncbi:MAG TPA: hypothetical protein VFA32_05690 [Dehalococcoidia bacterium]|jgi:hypothetical protein|nr:hypothetical protein [Dehalococcoidia bacterium]
MGNENTIIEHLSQTLNATRAELKSLANIACDGEFDSFITEVCQQDSRLQVREAGTYSEWYYLASANFERHHDNHRHNFIKSG